jgi:hypothetical protein
MARYPLVSASLGFLFLAACGGDGAAPSSPGTDGKTPDLPGAADAARGHVDAPPGHVDPARPDAGSQGSTPVRFVAVGDTGEGNEAQRQVGVAIRDKCAADGCELVLMLGDNIYTEGVTGVDDPQWKTKFEDPYRDIDLPFYSVLGNHDYGGKVLVVEQGGLGNEWWKGPIEVEYTQYSSKWIMPATHYTLRWKNLGFLVLDTNSLVWDNKDHGDQRAWYPSALMDLAGSEWIFLLGHHPYLSNGSHGNAGSYEAIEIAGKEVAIPVPILDGRNLKAFFDELVCGTVDVYLAGHDHNRQWLNENDKLCGTELLVSGAGAKVKGFKDRGNANHWQDDATEGFLYVVIDGKDFTGQFIDKNGVVNFERTFRR